MVHLISYDLNGREPSQSYADVKRLITENAIEYRHILASGWLVYTYSTPEEWVRFLMQALDPDDRIIVTQIPPHYWMFMEPEVHAWLAERV